MLIKFRPNTSGNGFLGLCRAIETAATAAAGSTPASPSYMTSWQVLSNTEAGGWTVAQTSPSAVATDAHVEITAPSTQSRFRKRFRMTYNESSTTTSTSYYGLFFPVAYFDYQSPNTSTWTEISNRVLARAGYAATTANYYTYLYNIPASDMDWVIAVTQKYLWLVPIDKQNRFAGALVPSGISDIEGIDDWQTNGPEMTFPFTALYTSSSSTGGASDTNIYDYQFHPFQMLYQMSYGYSTVYTNEQPYSQNSSVIYPTTVGSMQFGQCYDDGPRQYYNTYPKIFSRTSVGGRTQTLWPHYFGNPWQVGPIGQLSGIRYYSNQNSTNYTTDGTNWQTLYPEFLDGVTVTDGNGDKWLVFNKYGVMKGVAVK